MCATLGAASGDSAPSIGSTAKQPAAATSDLRSQRFYHGTRADLKAGDLIEPGNLPDADERDRMPIYVYLTPHLDGAIWGAELAVGQGPGRIYIVEPIGQVEEVSEQKSPGHPWMSCCSRSPLRVMGEVTEWPLYNGTRADLKPGNLIEPGYNSNYGKRTKAAYVYLTRTLDAATWGAELAFGEGPGRIYIVEPTGSIEDDPDLTNKKFQGNPTKSYRAREPLRVTGEVTDWQGHSCEALKAMKDHLERLKQLDVEASDD